MVFYSYLLLRPNYFVRKTIAEKVKAFALKKDNEVCAAMHVRRGDIIFHQGQARPYLALQTYVKAARAYIDKLGVTKILLITAQPDCDR